MALNEDALESLIQGGDRRHGTQVKVAERTDEFEVYERATPRDIMTDTLQAAEAAAQASAPPEADPQAPPAAPPAEPTAPQQAPEPTAPQQAPEPVAPQQAPEPTAPQQAPEPTAPHQTPEPVAPAPLEPAEPVAQEPARPAAPMLRFPGTTGKPPNLGLATDAPQDTPHAAPAPEAPPATEPWTHGPAATDTGADVQVALVQADFNPGITDEMARLATERARALGATVVQHVHVAGAFDLPLTVQTLAKRDGIEAVVALGCVIQGETGHDLTITDAAARQLARIACDTGTPIGFGVIGPRMTKEQAEARVQVGANAMESAVRQVRTLRAIADPAQVDTTQYAAQGH